MGERKVINQNDDFKDHGQAPAALECPVKSIVVDILSGECTGIWLQGLTV